MYIRFGWGSKKGENDNLGFVNEYQNGEAGRLATCVGCKLTVKKHLIGGSFSDKEGNYYCSKGCYKDYIG